MHNVQEVSQDVERYQTIRQHTLDFCNALHPEDHVIQPVVDVSPPKWHMAHTTWFFETFILKPFKADYEPFDENYNFLFNSYYDGVGQRTLREERGFLSRPTVKQIKAYREYVDMHMHELLEAEDNNPKISSRLELGLQHEQQHQELLVTDTKYSLGKNPIFPVYDHTTEYIVTPQQKQPEAIELKAGMYQIGYTGNGFCFDNELSVHQVYLQDARLAGNLVTNREYITFIEAGGYEDFRHWLMEGWGWVQEHQAAHPLYWHKKDGKWYSFELSGLQPLDLDAPVKHVSYYEADAYARWAGKRLPTEFEWEALHEQLDYGQLWEWTASAYLPYPHYKTAEGAIGEYNGKFMVNQMVLRGGSVASSAGHTRPTYRNFFHPHLQWQFTGIRLAEWV